MRERNDRKSTYRPASDRVHGGVLMRVLSPAQQARPTLPADVAPVMVPGSPLSVATVGPVRICAHAKNGSQIAAAFGEGVVVTIKAAMVDVISRHLSSASHSVSQIHVEDDLILVEIAERVAPVDLDRLIQTLLQALALEPVVIGEDRIHIAPSVWLAGQADKLNDPDVSVSDPVFAEISSGGEEWVNRYRRDMATAAQLFEDLNAGRLTFALQPVRMASTPDTLLYEECLLRRTGEAQRAGGAGLGILAAERLGLVRALDNYVVNSVLLLMGHDPTLRLGVNISAQSACLDAWWTVLAAKLAEEPDIAKRLIVEITETAGISSVNAATAFARHMVTLGCRIALDDFGVGRDAIRNLYALSPSIVKVDAFFVHDARNSLSGQSALKSLIGFSRAVGGMVVVEGIETKADSDAASLAGAVWQQGYFIQPPRLLDQPVQEGEMGKADPLPVLSLHRLHQVFLLAVPLCAIGIAAMWLLWSGIT